MNKPGSAFLLLFLLMATNTQSIKTIPVDKKEKNIHVFTTAQNTDSRLTETGILQFQKIDQLVEKDACIFVDDTHSFQTFLGIGGAITDAAAETFAKLSKDKQSELLSNYYDSIKGIGYTLARTNINSCDFSSDSYSYVNNNDKELKTFNIAHDKQYKIPLIKDAISRTGKLTLFVSPWSPPAWMKDNNDMLHGGKLLPQYRQAWANYYVKFIKAYEKLGMPVWGLTVQNEPMANQKWESCIFTAEDERDFIKNYLGPTLQKEGLTNKKLIAWDHNRDLIYQRASAILNDPKAAQYVWGIGFHWYETWTGSDMQFENVKLVNETFPHKNLIFTEGCAEIFDTNKINDWGLGEKYGRSMIHDFNAGTVAWTDWNILVDEKGGPNHAENYCFAPIIGDTKNDSLIYTNSYYYIGQFSKFIRPGARRINASSNRGELITTAFKNPNGKTAVIVMNTSDKKMDYYLCLKGSAAKAISLPHSIATFVF